jgi:hypothetical protein
MYIKTTRMNTNPFKDFADIFRNWSVPQKTIDWNSLYNHIYQQRLKRRRPYITFDIETAGLNDDLIVFQSIGRPDRGKSMHNYGIAMDMALISDRPTNWRIGNNYYIPLNKNKMAFSPNQPEYWRNAATYFSRPSQSDRIISHMMLLEATKREMHKHLGIPKERMGYAIGIDPFNNFDLLNELLNYKPKEMKRFKGNKVAVTGDVIELLKFEKALKELGYENTGGRGDVFHYRGEKRVSPFSEQEVRDEEAIALYLTLGLHHCANKPGQYTPARNDGNAKDYGVRFTLPQDFEKALKLASELSPLYTTKDGVYIYDTKTKVFGLKKVENTEEGNHYPKDRVYRGHVIVSTDFSMQISPRYTWFSSLDAAKKHVDKTVPLFTTEDGADKFVGDTVWYVRPNFVYHFWKSGVKADSNIEDNLKRGYKFFNTEEKCVDYIKRNKPYFNLSQNEMQEFLNGFLQPLGLSTTVEALEFPKDFVKRD